MDERRFPTDEQIASMALQAGAKSADVIGLLDNIRRYRELGLIRDWTEESLRD